MSLVGDPILLVIAVMLVLTILLFVRSRIRLPQGQRKAIQKRSEEKGETRNCPNCGGTMEQGYLSSRGGIFWTRNPMFGSVGAAWGFPGAEPIGLFGMLPTRSHRAFRCTRCGTIILEPERTRL